MQFHFSPLELIYFLIASLSLVFSYVLRTCFFPVYANCIFIGENVNTLND